MKKKTIAVCLLHVALCVALVMTLVAPQMASAADPKKIAILPFEINSKGNAVYLREAISTALFTEFQKSGRIGLIDRERILKALNGQMVGETAAYRIGQQTGADYVLAGSLTELGGQISADGKVLDVGMRKTLAVVVAQGKGLDSIGAIAAKMKADIFIKIGAGQMIARVDFKGNRKIEGSAISQVIKSVKGAIFSEADLSADIKSIYKMGYFSNVEVEGVDGPEGKILTFTVQEKPLIAEIKITGNKAINTDDILAVLTIKARQTLNPDKIKGDLHKVKELYDSKGFYNAEISDSVEKEGEKDARVIITIVENAKLLINTITFEGNDVYPAKEIRKLMTTTEWTVFHFLSDSGVLKNETLKQDTDKIAAFYLNNGFINVHVGEPQITHDKKWIYVKIPITEGKQYRVGTIDIAGDTLKTSRNDLTAKLTIGKKPFYNREAVMKDVDYLTQVCNDEGFAYADVVPRTIPNDKDQTVNVAYQIAKGKQVYFNRITISGNTKTRDKVIRRQLAVVEGDLYSRTKLKQSYMELNRLRYFEEVDFQTQKGSDETLTDVMIHVKEKPTGMLSVGAGYSAVQNAMLMAQISQQNLFGRGQTLALKASLSSTVAAYEFSFVEPWLFDMPLWSKFDLWNSATRYDTYDVNSSGFGVTFGYPIWERISGYLGYRLSMDDVVNITDTASASIKAQEGKRTLSSLIATLTRDTTDDYMFPSTGSRSSGTINYTGGILQGSADFIKYELSSSQFFPLPLDTVFGIRERGGYLQNTGNAPIPVYQRFYLGGINSLRGLRYVGPTDPVTGDVTGGTTMLNFNAEYVFPLIKNAGMKGVIFYDTGNAWDSGYHLDDLRKTTGAGVRWYSPIGPLRLEWGYVLDPKNNEPTSRWEFSMGMFM